MIAISQRVAVVTPGRPGAGYGLEQIVLRIGNALRDSGAKVSFVYPGKGGRSTEQGINYVPVSFVPQTFVARQLVFNVRALGALGEFDVINVHGDIGGASALLLRGTRVVETFHGTRVAAGQLWRNKPGLHRYLGRAASLTLAVPEAIAGWCAASSVAVAPHVRDEVRRYYGVKSCDLIENEVALYPGRRIRRPNTRPRVVTLSHQDVFAKGIDLFIAAARCLPNCEFTVIGAQRPRGDVPANVRYLGEVEHDALMAKLLEFDLFVTPSRYEGLPLSVLEALSTGLPVVASEIAAPVAAVGNGSVVVMRDYDVQSVVEAVNDALDSLSARSECALAFAEANDGTNFDQRYRQLLLGS